MHIIVPALAALSLAATSVQASAQTVSVTVPIADLDLSTEGGRATLESRLEAAMDLACGKVEVRKVLSGADRHRCLQEAEVAVWAEIARRAADNPTFALNR